MIQYQIIHFACLILSLMKSKLYDLTFIKFPGCFSTKKNVTEETSYLLCIKHSFKYRLFALLRTRNAALPNQ